MTDCSFPDTSQGATPRSPRFYDVTLGALRPYETLGGDSARLSCVKLVRIFPRFFTTKLLLKSRSVL
jgi:hypothetical protein